MRPHRVLVLGGGLPAFFDASEEEKREVFLPAFKALLRIKPGTRKLSAVKFGDSSKSRIGEKTPVYVAGFERGVRPIGDWSIRITLSTWSAPLSSRCAPGSSRDP